MPYSLKNLCSAYFALFWDSGPDRGGTKSFRMGRFFRVCPFNSLWLARGLPCQASGPANQTSRPSQSDLEAQPIRPRGPSSQAPGPACQASGPTRQTQFARPQAQLARSLPPSLFLFCNLLPCTLPPILINHCFFLRRFAGPRLR